ncbi:DNA-directed RNA polymerase III subunit RPC8 [Tremella mesenterica]|uniref:DNA-directed RNA polymerase III subunit RPC8 n=1 Tax=Tremella mesenterica TaxID=5217 RepID=A0A4Q1BSH0_TREME|nr:DNA-directed RNA polymerase III subunit RPC8 [Tremella mesenterica]
MFILVAVKDTIPVPPKAFALPPHITIKDAINRKYSNKLVSQKGLGLSVWDILTAEDGKVTWGNGLMYYKVSFRLMLFSPFISEIIVGKVLSSSKKYIRISLGFFRDIYILPAFLPPNSAFDQDENKWFWYSDEDDRVYSQIELLNTIYTQRLYIDIGEPVRFRVDSIEWQDIRPPPPPNELGELPPQKDPIDRAGMKVLATIAESGLGVVSWWDGQEEEVVMEE